MATSPSHVATQSHPPSTEQSISPVRRIMFYVCAVLLTLVVTADFISHAMDFYAPHHIHVIAHEIVSGATIACALSLLIAPRRNVAAAQQLILLFALGWLFDALALRFSGIGVILLLGVAVAVLHPLRARVFSLKGAFHWPLAVLAVVSAVPLTMFSLSQVANQRADFEPEHAVLGHWEWVATFAVVVFLFALLASLGTRGFRLPGWSAGLGAILYGSGSLLFPGEASAATLVWAVVAVAGGVLCLAFTEWMARPWGVAGKDVDR